LNYRLYGNPACFISFKIARWICQLARVAEGWVAPGCVATAWDRFVIPSGDRVLLSGQSEIERGREGRRRREVNLPVNRFFSLSLSAIVFFYHSRTFRLRFQDDTLLVPAVRAGVACSLFLGLCSYLSVISYSEPVQPLSLFYLRIKVIASLPSIQFFNAHDCREAGRNDLR